MVWKPLQWGLATKGVNSHSGVEFPGTSKITTPATVPYLVHSVPTSSSRVASTCPGPTYTHSAPSISSIESINATHDFPFQSTLQLLQSSHFVSLNDSSTEGNVFFRSRSDLAVKVIA